MPGVRLPSLVPSAGLTSASGNAWHTTGPNGHFDAPADLPRGALHLKLRLRAPAPVRVRLYFDIGYGFNRHDAFLFQRGGAELELEEYLPLVEPARALRLCPRETPGEFTLDEFELEPVSAARRHLRNFQGRLRLAADKGFLRLALREGLALARQGRWREFITRATQPGPGTRVPVAWQYHSWRQRHALRPAERRELRAWAEKLADAPRFSILMPVEHATVAELERTLASLAAQFYPHWEARLAGPGLADAERARLCAAHAARDPRIHISAAGAQPGRALQAAFTWVSGAYTGVIPPGDALAEEALCRVAQALEESPDADFLYTDSDQVDAHGRHVAPEFKPDWSPEYFCGYPYTGRLALYRTAWLRERGGFPAGPAEEAEYALLLEHLPRLRDVQHLPEILYHAQDAEPDAARAEARAAAGRRALGRLLASTGQSGIVTPGAAPGLNKFILTHRAAPLISIVIPSTCLPKRVDGREVCYVEECVQSIFGKSTCRNFEVLILDRHSMPAALEKSLARLGVRRVTYDEPFNWSRVSNLGAAEAAGTHLLFLNDDMAVISPDWLERLLEFSMQPDVGAAGGKLLFGDGTLQHVGISTFFDMPLLVDSKEPGDEAGSGFQNLLPHACTALAGACLMTRKEVFRELGGFEERLVMNYNDVDYCLRVWQSGRRVIYTPYAQLYHYESATRATGEDLPALRVYWQKWPAEQRRERFHRRPCVDL